MIPVRSSIQSTMVWPNANDRALILDIISLAPRLDYERFPGGKLVPYPETSVFAYLENVGVEIPRRWAPRDLPVYIVEPAVARAQDLALLLDPSHGTAQMGAVVAQDVYLLLQLLDFVLRKVPLASILHDTRALALLPGDQQGLYHGSLVLLL